jgi:hypothetical protein
MKNPGGFMPQAMEPLVAFGKIISSGPVPAGTLEPEWYADTGAVRALGLRAREGVQGAEYGWNVMYGNHANAFAQLRSV